jgi:uncharacterized protein (TIGR03435 family)
MTQAAIRISLLLLVPLLLRGQVEVASIKPSKPGTTVRDARSSFPPGRYEALNITLSEILDGMNGYTGLVEGGPKWAYSDRYDIIAKLDPVTPPNQRKQAVVAMLGDRFKLSVHKEAREQSALALTLGKKPPRLTPAKDEEAAKITSDAYKAVFQGTYMIMFTNYLHQVLHTQVVDRTGMNTRFNFSLSTWITLPKKR